MSTPAGGETSYRNSDLCSQLRVWAKQEGSGRSFDSSGGFVLPSGAERSPDASWVLRERLAALRAEEKSGFLPLAPDFAIELLSPSDRLKNVKEKMAEYLASGVRLGWLIDPFSRQVHIYRPNAAPQILDNPATLSGEPELPGFVLDLAEIWDPDI